MDLNERLNHVFYPRTIAVIGASAAPGKLGHACVASLLEAGFRGRIYPVNPSANEVLGLTAYPSVGAVPGEIDLALIVLPARLTVAAAEECAQHHHIGSTFVACITSYLSSIKRDHLCPSGIQSVHDDFQVRVLALSQYHRVRDDLTRIKDC